MVKVQLKGGTIVEVPNGKRAHFTFKSDETTSRGITEVGATLDVIDAKGYGGNEVASFLKDEVVGYVVEPDEEE